jgi:type IV secretory pathway VirJ component
MKPLRQEERAMRRVLRGLVGAAAAIGAALLGLFAAVGWFGGPIFTFVPARTAPAPALRGIAAVLLSGDMGFHIGMAGAVAAKLAAAGIPVVGVNSLTFFRTERSPAETAALVQTAIARAVRLTHRPRILLVGQSYGADVLPSGYAGVAAPLRARVALLALVVPGETVALQASPADVLPVSAPSRDALPAAARLGATPTLCVFGAEQRDSLCARLQLPHLTRAALPGGHYLHRDAGAVARALLAGLAGDDRKGPS